MGTIRQGDRGQSVADLQAHLNRRGFGPLVEDGIYGAGTLAAVVTYQQAHALDADGIVGPATWRSLRGDDDVQGLDRPNPTQLATWARQQQVSELRRSAVLSALHSVGRAEQPKGSNAGPAIDSMVAGYRKHWRIPGTGGVPWCQLAVSWWTADALMVGFMLPNADEARHVDWKRHPYGKWCGGVAQCEAAMAHALEPYVHTPSDQLDPTWLGYQYTMARVGSGSDSASSNAGHTGLIVGTQGDRVLTVDGNVGDAVGLRWRNPKTIRAVIRWWEHRPT